MTKRPAATWGSAACANSPTNCVCMYTQRAAAPGERLLEGGGGGGEATRSGCRMCSFSEKRKWGEREGWGKY